MLVEDRLIEHQSDAPMFFNPGALNAWKELPIFSRTWRYRWENSTVEIMSPDGYRYHKPSWVILEISEAEYRAWERDPFDQPVVVAKDVEDYIREEIMRAPMARKISAGVNR